VSSSRRVEGVLRLLKEEGTIASRPPELRSPVGLDIGAETPEEIAVAILAEVVMVRRGGRGGPLSLPT
ncbi:MAG: XdhC family protein, partial [Anaerolineae bacterium]